VFRYLALAWDAASQDASHHAARLSLELGADRAWQAALRQPGLLVFVAGAQQHVNTVLRLQANGVVLGQLFRRLGAAATAANAALTDQEQDTILRSEGQALVSDHWGRYVGFLPAQAGATRVLRDPSGTLPCFMLRHEGVTLVFSWLEDVLGLVSHLRPLGVDWDALAAHLLLGDLGGMATCLQGVYQVLPGQAVDLETGDSQMLWQPLAMAHSPRELRNDQAADLLRSTVRDVTLAWASSHDTLLLRLSGGVDSSILASCLSGAGHDVVCVNYHSPGSDSDERGYARLAAARAGHDLIERQRDPHFPMERILRMARMPHPVNHLGWTHCATDAALAAAHSARAMFTGAGGDPLFYEFGAWWPLADYLNARGLDRGFLSAALDAARLGRVSLWQALALAISDRFRAAHVVREHANRSVLLSRELLQVRPRRERYVNPALLRPTGLPIGKHMQAVALLHPIGYYDPFEQAAAPEIVNPLLSQPLVELCLCLPSYQLTEGGQGRALARRAFAADLPPQIVHRRSKGGMEEHSVALLQHHLDFVRALLLEGQLASRGLIDRAKVEEVLSGRPTTLLGHPSQIHGLIAIEAWLTRWATVAS
jgi:asparagine synthase (glutamine-hydrolysing)